MRLLTFLLLSTFPLFIPSAYGQKDINDIISNAEVVPSYEMREIFDLDVINYYNLDETYNTELKKAVYKKTDDYKQSLAEIKQKKAEMMKSTFYKKLKGKEYIKDYDLRKKGFPVVLGDNMVLGTTYRAPKSVDRILFAMLPTTLISDDYDKKIKTEMLYLKVDETIGLQIEENKQYISIYFLFTPTTTEKVTFTAFNGREWVDVTQKLVKANKVRVIVANDVDGDIYYDKTF